jgi:hypothetical protein
MAPRDIPPPPPRLDQQRDRQHKFRAPRNQDERDAWAAERWIEGWTYQQIADAMDLAGKGTAWQSVQRGLLPRREVTAENLERVRAAHRARLEAATEVAVEIMYKDHVHVSQGRIMKDDDGVPLIDDGPKLAAADRIRSLSESLRKLDGIDAATKSEITSINMSPDADLLDRLRRVRERVAEEERQLREGDGG